MSKSQNPSKPEELIGGNSPRKHSENIRTTVVKHEKNGKFSEKVEKKQPPQKKK